MHIAFKLSGLSLKVLEEKQKQMKTNSPSQAAKKILEEILLKEEREQFSASLKESLEKITEKENYFLRESHLYLSGSGSIYLWEELNSVPMDAWNGLDICVAHIPGGAPRDDLIKQLNDKLDDFVEALLLYEENWDESNMKGTWKTDPSFDFEIIQDQCVSVDYLSDIGGIYIDLFQESINHDGEINEEKLNQSILDHYPIKQVDDENYYIFDEGGFYLYVEAEEFKEEIKNRLEPPY